MKKILFLFYLLTGLVTMAYSGDVFVHYLGTGSAYWALPDTGQTSSFTGTFGEDHDYQPANSQLSYSTKTISGGDVVVDNRTGLMWVQDPETDLPSPWPGTMNWKSALSACEGLTFAGYDDWRLPNSKELISIVENEGLAPFINAVFSCTDRYWTSTTYMQDISNAVDISFNFALSNYADKIGDLRYVQPVRGGP